MNDERKRTRRQSFFPLLFIIHHSDFCILFSGVFMLSATPPLFQTRRGPTNPKAVTPPAPPPVVGPVLVAATYDPGASLLTLTFDRTVDLSNITPSQITVNDPVTNMSLMTGTDGAHEIALGVVTVPMQPNGPATGAQVLLSASADNGIVSYDDGTPWAGVTDVVLPFG